MVSASTADLTAIDVAAALNGLAHADDLALERAPAQAVEAAEAREDDAAGRGYRLLAILCTFHLRVEDLADA